MDRAILSESAGRGVRDVRGGPLRACGPARQQPQQYPYLIEPRVGYRVTPWRGGDATAVGEEALQQLQRHRRRGRERVVCSARVSPAPPHCSDVIAPRPYSARMTHSRRRSRTKRLPISSSFAMCENLRARDGG